MRLGTDHRLGEAVRFFLRGVTGGAHLDICQRGVQFTLLNDVGKLVSEQVASTLSRRRVLTGSERDLVPQRVGFGIHRSCGLRRAVVGVHTNPAEVVPEARFKKDAGAFVERLAS